MNAPHVYLAGWQKIAWALDEDLRWARAALEDRVVFTSLARAQVVLAAWWPAIEKIGPAALRKKTVLCFADNPPAFYLTRPGFVQVAGRIDLWIARTREAQNQFQALGLPVERAPYCVDPEIFRPLTARDAIRRELQLPPKAFVVGNFFRDSEGSDLRRPKAQKGADLFLEIVRGLHRRVPETVVLLAGPRRHWLLRQLETEGIPFRFGGELPTEEDDYERNILDRPTLNRLYQALDVCLIPSRWEGGPYAVLEALLAGRSVLSTPVGLSRDLLAPEALFRSVDEAVEKLTRHAHEQTLTPAADHGRDIARSDYSLSTLRERLGAITQGLPAGPADLKQTMSGVWHAGWTKVRPAVWSHENAAVREFRARVVPARGAETFYVAESSDRAALTASASGIAGALE